MEDTLADSLGVEVVARPQNIAQRHEECKYIPILGLNS